MKKLFLDTEFNGFGGKLMSMALVPEDRSLPEFYCELEIKDQLHPWVRENVAPHMILVPSTYGEFQRKLGDYLWKIGDVTIVADWPDDIKYFCESLITAPGETFWPIHNIKFELDWGINYTSEVPHNALHDARGIRDYFAQLKQ